MDAPASGQSSETSDAILNKAKATISAKMEDAAAVEFVDAKRAIRKNTLGQPIDTICGHVKGKKPSGEEIGARQFLYLVKEDEAYVVNNNPESVPATAYRNICANEDSRIRNIPLFNVDDDPVAKLSGCLRIFLMRESSFAQILRYAVADTDSGLSLTT